MMRGLWKLTWLEIKIFVREPLGVFGTVGIPVVVFLVMSRLIGPGLVAGGARPNWPGGGFLPVLVSTLMALNAVASLVTIISIYREGGILKRLRATPLRPQVILTAHVLVKLLFTLLTIAVMVLAGRRYYPMSASVPLLSFTVALLFSTWAILSLGFVIASIVPTARFAQPIATFLLYPMMAMSGLFFPIALLPPALQVVSKVVPLTYAVSLLDGIWKGDPWSAHGLDVAALVVTFVVCTAVSAKVFRWE
ncbi:MAG TPA: ABC transporter permease [Vicinamibacterales bacterium]|nr:ABC transporter permease [Vicinamibacterales bacterium]